MSVLVQFYADFALRDTRLLFYLSVTCMSGFHMYIYMKIEANSQWSCPIVCGVKICKHTGTCAKFQRSESRLCVCVCLYNCDYHFSCGHILLCIAFMNLLQLPLSLRRQVTWTMVHEMCPGIFKNCSNNYKTSRIRYKECYVVPRIFFNINEKIV